MEDNSEVKLLKYKAVVLFTIPIRAYYDGEAFGLAQARNMTEHWATLDAELVKGNVHLNWVELTWAEGLPTSFTIEDVQLIEEKDDAN
jgi:hypothetical protein